jgi:hypothetical protein
MYLFLSFVVALISLYYLGELSAGINNDATAPIITLFIYSIVTIIKEVKREDSYIYGDDVYHGSNRGWYNDIYDDDYYTGRSYNVNWGKNHNVSSTKNENVEVFAPDEKDKKKVDNRPLVYYHPSQKEIKEKIAELEKSRWWRIKRKLYSIIGVDITSKLRQPGYKRLETTPKVASKEDHSRFMPNNITWNRDSEEYNKVAKLLTRSCDIAFDGESFVEETESITKDNNEKNEGREHQCSASVNNI